MRLLASLPLLLPAALEALAIPLPPGVENTEADRVEYTQLLRFNGADLQNNLLIIPGASAVAFSTHTGPAGVEIGFDARTFSSPPPPDARIDVRSYFDFEYDLVVANISHVPACAKASFGTDGNGNAIASYDSKPDAGLPSISTRQHQSSCKPTIHHPLSSILSKASAQNTGLVFAILRTDKSLQIYLRPGSETPKERDLTTIDTQFLGKLVAELRGDDQCDIDSFSSQAFALGLDLGGGGADAGCPPGARQGQFGHGAYWGIESIAFYDRGNGQDSLPEELELEPLDSEESESVGNDGSDLESADVEEPENMEGSETVEEKLEPENMEESETVEEKLEPESLEGGESLKEDGSDLEDHKDELDENNKSDLEDTPKEHSEEAIENGESDYKDLNLEEESDSVSAKVNEHVDEKETDEVSEIVTTPKSEDDSDSRMAADQPDPASVDDVPQDSRPKPENPEESDALRDDDAYSAEEIEREIVESEKVMEETIKELEKSVLEEEEEEEEGTREPAPAPKLKEPEPALDETDTSSSEPPSVEEADETDASKQPSDHASAVPPRETAEKEESPQTVADARGPAPQDAVPAEVVASQALVESPGPHDADSKDGHKVAADSSAETNASIATADGKTPEKEFVVATRPEQQTTAETTPDRKEEPSLPPQQQQQPAKQPETAPADTKEDKPATQPSLLKITSDDVGVLSGLKDVFMEPPAQQSGQPSFPVGGPVGLAPQNFPAPPPPTSNAGVAGSPFVAPPQNLPAPAALISDARPRTSVKVKTGGLFGGWRPRTVKITRNH